MDFNAQKPIYQQIAERIEDNILSGQWKEGERIASVRELGVTFAVNPATVLRAYDELSELGVIEQQRGIGYFVIEGAMDKVRSLRREEFLKVTLPEIFASMKSLNVTFEELADLYSKSKDD